MTKQSVDFSKGLRAMQQENAIIRHPERGADVKQPPKQKSREGKVSVTSWVDPAVRKQLAQLSLDHNKTKTQELLASERWNLMFEKYGKAPIA